MNEEPQTWTDIVMMSEPSDSLTEALITQEEVDLWNSMQLREL